MLQVPTRAEQVEHFCFVHLRKSAAQASAIAIKDRVPTTKPIGFIRKEKIHEQGYGYEYRHSQ